MQQPLRRLLLLQYEFADTAWYEPSGGHGTRVAPYWVSTPAGSGALASLPVGGKSEYAVAGKGSGTPITMRALNCSSTGDGYDLTFWVPAAVFALGTPESSDVVVRYPEPADMTVALGSGGTLAAASGKLTFTRSTGVAANISSVDSRSSATDLGFFFSDFAVAGVSALSTQTFITVRATTDSNQALFLEFGGTGSPGSQITKLNVYNSVPTLVDTGVTLASLSYWCAVINISTNLLTVYQDGVSVYSVNSVLTSGTTNRTQLQLGGQSGTAVTFSRFAGVVWS